MLLATIKALVCDVFGTVVDIHDSLVRDLTACGAAQGLDLDWQCIVTLWREGRRQRIAQLQRQEAPWMTLDARHPLVLADVLAQCGVPQVSPADLAHWSRAWHRLTPWARRCARPQALAAQVYCRSMPTRSLVWRRSM